MVPVIVVCKDQLELLARQDGADTTHGKLAQIAASLPIPTRNQSLVQVHLWSLLGSSLVKVERPALICSNCPPALLRILTAIRRQDSRCCMTRQRSERISSEIGPLWEMYTACYLYQDVCIRRFCCSSTVAASPHPARHSRSCRVVCCPFELSDACFYISFPSAVSSTSPSILHSHPKRTIFHNAYARRFRERSHGRQPLAKRPTLQQR